MGTTMVDPLQFCVWKCPREWEARDRGLGEGVGGGRGEADGFSFRFGVVEDGLEVVSRGGPAPVEKGGREALVQADLRLKGAALARGAAL